MQRLPECCLIDANVLFSVVKREIILSMALDGLLNVRWSETILEEMRKALHRLFLKKYGNVLDADRNSLRVYNWIKTALPSSIVQGDHSSTPIPLELPAPADLHVLQSAIHCNADIIVTDNIRDFPSSVVKDYGIEVKTADEVIANVINAEWDRSMLIVSRIFNRIHSPMMTFTKFISIWETEHDLVRTADRLRKGKMP